LKEGFAGGQGGADQAVVFVGKGKDQVTGQPTDSHPSGAADQKWRDRAAERFNPDGKRRNWSKGAAGAVAVAFKVAGD
jgi:hypothetical protein